MDMVQTWYPSRDSSCVVKFLYPKQNHQHPLCKAICAGLSTVKMPIPANARAGKNDQVMQHAEVGIKVAATTGI
jgi:hypothetical protein